MKRKFTEAEIQALGGLSRKDRSLPHIDEIAELGLQAIPAFREAVGRGYGVREWWECVKQSVSRLKEANSETALGFLLRKGVQAEATNWYNLSERKWQKYAKQVASTTVAEWYAPLYHTTLPTEIQSGQRFPEAAVQGEDSNLRNRTFGQIVAFDRRLFDDDQTGQIQGYTEKLGAGMAQTESVWTASRLVGAARTYANLTVPVSAYATTDINGTAVTTPFSTTLYGSASGNRPSTYQTLSIGPLSRAYVQTLNAVDPMSNKIIVNPNRLVVSSQDALKGDMLLKPGPYPGIMGPSDLAAASVPVLGGTQSFTGAANQGVPAGFPGGAFAANPFAGMGWELVVERYLRDWAWLLGEAGKGFLMQVRDPLEIIQEAPNSGSYFDFDSIRYRSRERFEADWVGGGSRFWYLGDDGTVTGTL